MSSQVGIPIQLYGSRGSSAYKNRTFEDNIVYFSKLLPFVSKRDVCLK